MKNKKISMKVVNPHCAGIDVGSQSHFVAIGQAPSDVKEFGVYALDLKEMAHWLHQNGVTTVAMESTGQYWQNLFVELMNSEGSSGQTKKERLIKNRAIEKSISSTIKKSIRLEIQKAVVSEMGRKR